LKALRKTEQILSQENCEYPDKETFPILVHCWKNIAVFIARNVYDLLSQFGGEAGGKYFDCRVFLK
jgi:hypothetical protein